MRHNLINPNDPQGRTYKQINKTIPHKIPLNTLVEIIPWEKDCEWAGMRLYVRQYQRDCDGSPLYTLGPKNCNPNEKPWECYRGFSPDSLKIVS